jgi:hypothetical protein
VEGGKDSGASQQRGYLRGQPRALMRDALTKERRKWVLTKWAMPENLYKIIRIFFIGEVRLCRHILKMKGDSLRS